MSFLTPLYIAGLFAVSLPVLFHLIRRAPRGRLTFSSLMFLSPSPPRLTRRSRLDNLLLLALRISVLVLLALAFARPFLRRSTRLGIDRLAGRRVAVLLDTSASMRRAGLWEQALAEVGGVIDDLGPGDDAALFTFDAEVVEQVGFDGGVRLDPRTHAASLRARLATLAPTWDRSNLGVALIAAGEELHGLDDAGSTGAETLRQIVLVSDFPEGSRVDALQAYTWPDDVHLELRRVAPAEATNAALALAGAADPLEQDPDPHVRVRVVNDRQSTAERFQLRWEGGPRDTPADEPIGVYVPPGESRTVRVPRPAEYAVSERLVLLGDAHTFDNALYLVPTKQEEVPLLYLGSDAADDAQGLRYYLQRALPETPERKVRLVARAPDEPIAPDDLLEARLVVVGEAVPDRQAEQLNQYLRGGGAVFCVLADAAAGASLSRIMGLDGLAAEEAPVDDYAMLGEILFTHPLLAVFADPRYSDFTKIHFWKHRRVEVEGVPRLEVLARFDDGDPALFEWTCEKGRLLVLTSGWHPDDSQLARSTKFVPLVSGILERSGEVDSVRSRYEVGDRVMLGAAGSAPASATVDKPDGAELKLPADARSFRQTDLPGVYCLTRGDSVRHFAVNLAPEEGRTAPRELGELEDLGVRLGRQPTRTELVKKQRQMQNAELEKRQKLWRWLIVAALGVLIAETWLAGYLSRPAAHRPEMVG
jgi:hypothetical protein